MKVRWPYVAAAGLVVAGGTLFAVLGRAGEAPGSGGAARQDVELTVYSEDFAMVHEVRPAELRSGSNLVRVPEVSTQLDPASVLLGWHGASGDLPTIVANSYDLGVHDGQSVLKRYLGRSVEIVRYNQDGREGDRQQGRLMVAENGDMVVQSGDRFYVHPEGTVVAKATPDVVTIPQLSVQVESPSARKADLDVGYLTRGLSWSADYVAKLSGTDDTMALECWATVTNRSGANYPGAKVTLVAGAPNRAVVEARGREEMAASGPAPSDSNGQEKAKSVYADGHGVSNGLVAAPEAVGDLHAFRVKAPTTVVQDRMNRMLMLQGERVTIKRDYNTRAPQLGAWYGDGWGTPEHPTRGTVAVAIVAYNRKTDGLGDPLPKGAIRFYEPDSSGTLRYAGAAEIADTPTDQRLDLTLANAFDLTTEWKCVRTTKVDKHTVRRSIEMVLHNDKSREVTLRVVQGISSRWRIVTESHRHTQLDANNVQWSVPIPASQKVVVAYTVDLKV